MLEERGFETAVAEQVVAVLLEERLIDDRRFVENFTSYHAGRGQGPLRVRAALREKGVAGEIVEACLDAYPDWRAALEAARRKKFGAPRPTSYPDRIRQARFLSYRGFTSAQIRSVLGSGVDTEDWTT